MNSKTHRQNLLDPHFTEIGIALAEGTFQGRATTFVVQMFGAPASPEASQGGPAEASEVATVQELTAPKSASEPALATTVPVPANVLGESSKAVAKNPAPIADIRTPSAQAPVGAIVHNAPAWGFLATSPKTTLRYAYYLVGLLVLLALLVTTGLELRWHHRKAFAVALCLLLFMSGLFVVADYAVFSEPVLADSTGSTGSQQASSPQADASAPAESG